MLKVLARALVLCGLTLSTGCGADPARLELEAYRRTTLDPVAQEERASAEQLTAAMTDVLSGKLDVRAAQARYRDTFAERFRSLSARLLEKRPENAELAQLNAKLAGQYQQTAAELERAAVELGRGDWAAFEQAHARLAVLGFEGVRSDLAAFAQAHGLDVEHPVASPGPQK